MEAAAFFLGAFITGFAVASLILLSLQYVEENKEREEMAKEVERVRRKASIKRTMRNLTTDAKRRLREGTIEE